MKQTNALNRMLVDLTAVYNDGEKVDVEFSSPDEGSYAAPPRGDRDEPHVAVAPNVRRAYGRSISKANELRVVTDTLSHEVEHIRESDLESKQEISEEYGADGKIAGTVANILEDQYIDRTRTERFRGLQKAHAFKVDTIMENRHRRPPVDTLDDLGRALVEGLTQVAFAGYAKGIADADDDVREFLGWVRPKVDEARHEDDPDARLDIARDVTDKLLSYLPDEDDREGARERADEVQGSGDDAATDSVDFEPDPDADPADADDPEGGDAGDLDDLDADDLTPEQAQQMLDDAEEGDADADADASIDADDLRERADEADDESDAQSGDGDESDDESDSGETTSDESDADSDAESDDTSVGDDGSPGSSRSEATNDDETTDVDSRSDTDDELDAMEQMDEADSSAEWHGLTEDEDYEEDADFERRAEQLERQISEDQTDLAKRRQKRDDRIENDAAYIKSDSVREKLRDTGLGREVEEAFHALKTRDRDIADKSGPRIHKRNAIRHVAGDTSETRVYERTLRAETGDRTVMVSCDLSGSMNEQSLKVAVGALHIATRAIDDQLIVSGWTEANGDAVNRLVTGPDEEFDWSHLDAVHTEGGTPTAEGVRDARSLVKEGTKRENVVIVITDGKPNHGRNAVEQANREVEETRQEAKVIGLGVGRVRESTMTEIFGEDGFVTADMDDLADKLIEVYQSQMKVSETPQM